MCVCMCWGQGLGLGGIGLWVGSNIMKLFHFLCIAASHTTHVHHFSCVYTLVVIIYIIIMYYFLEQATFDFVFLLENVGRIL